MAEFYAHMEFSKDALGTLHSITTMVQGQEITLDQQFLVDALNLDPLTLNLPKINRYIDVLGDSFENCVEFRQNLAFASDQIVPIDLFDVPAKVGIQYLAGKNQFLGRLLRYNIMPARVQRKLVPYDLYLIKSIMTKSLNINLPHFLLTIFKHCYLKICMGFGLLLSVIFKFLNLNLTSAGHQLIKTKNFLSHIVIPTRPLFLYDENESDTINIDYQMHILSDMQNFIIANISVLSSQMGSLSSMVHSLQRTIDNLLEQHAMPFYGASVGSVQYDPMAFSPIPMMPREEAKPPPAPAKFQNFPILSPLPPLDFNSPLDLGEF